MENGASTRGLLHRFELNGVEITEGQVPSASQQHGSCSFAKPVEVLYKGLRCTGKRISQELAQRKHSDDAAGILLERYEAHCARLSELRHPHVVQFMGVFYEAERDGEDADANKKQRLPVMVTEHLPASLDGVLQRYGTLPDELSYSILKDVSLGLTYLHSRSPPILHGELVASNILLAWDMTAKLSDIGVSSLLGLSLKQRRQLGRHTLVHLPPEMLSLQVESMTKKADSYACGVLMIHALSGEFPEYLARKAELVSKTGSVADMKGVDDLLGGINSDHPLSSLVLQCISRTSDLRPEASRIYSIISEMMLQFPVPSFERRIEILQRVVKATKERKMSGQENTRHQIARKDSIANLANSLEIEHLKLQIEELHVENRGLRTSLSKQQGVVSARDHEMAAKLMAKDQEILAKQQELAALQSTIDSCQATISAKEATVHGLKNQLKHLQMYLATKHEPHLLSPKAQLKWRQSAHLPQAMVFAQAVSIGTQIYFGSGTTTMGESDCLRFKIFRYNSTQEKWSPVSKCPVVGFGMVNFMDSLTLVGGAYESTEGDSAMPYSLTNHVYVYNEDVSHCERTIPPMPSARLLPTVITYGSTMAACGGIMLDAKHDICLSTVEVYSSENRQWYQAEPLPLACIGMTFATIHETCYLLGGFTDTDFDHPTKVVFSVSLPRLIDDALTRSDIVHHSPNKTDPPTRIWQSIPDVPRYAATASTIGSCLLAIGGSDERLEHKSGALHVFSPLTNSWIRVDDIPVTCFACAAVRLPRGELVIMGGMGQDEEDALKTVFRGRISLD